MTSYAQKDYERKLDQASSIAEFDHIHTMVMSMKVNDKKKTTTSTNNK
jgi:hypothetical protein